MKRENKRDDMQTRVTIEVQQQNDYCKFLLQQMDNTSKIAHSMYEKGLNYTVWFYLETYYSWVPISTED